MISWQLCIFKFCWSQSLSVPFQLAWKRTHDNDVHIAINVLRKFAYSEWRTLLVVISLLLTVSVCRRWLNKLFQATIISKTILEGIFLSYRRRKRFLVFVTFYFLTFFSERTFAICCRRSVCRLSVCRLSSVTFVRPTQAVQILRNISTALGALAIHWHPLKISWRSPQRNPSAGGVKHKRGSKI